VLQGSGFVEGAGRYTVSGSVVEDTSTSASVDVQSNNGVPNAQARLDSTVLARRGFGQATVQTAGGTSNSVALNTLRPATENGPVGALRDLAIDAANNQFWVADASNPARLLRIDTRDGRVLQSLTLPAEVGSPSSNASLQVLQQSISLANTHVPAGSLLVFNGDSAPDRVVALNATTGEVIASLSLADYNLTAAVFDAATGQLWVADARGAAQRLVQLDPDTGAELGALTLPVSLSAHAALAIHPVTGNVWVGSNTLGAQVMELTRDGSVLRRLDLSTQGLGTGVVTGLAFSADGTLHAASTGGVVIRARLDLDSAVVRPTLTAVVATASQGVAARADVAASNAGQVIELQGTHFDASTRVVFEQRDSTGKLSTVAIKPLLVNGDGTRLQVRVPDLATTGMVRVVNSGTSNFTGLGTPDSRYRNVTVSFVATQSTTVLRFADGGLGSSNQSWGLDNVRVRSGNTTVFEDDFEAAPNAAWSDRTVDGTALGSLGRFSGRFNGIAGQTLTLRDLQPGQTYTLSFDLLVLDLWSNPDEVIRVTADDQPIWRESFVNASNIAADVLAAQSYGQSEGIRLQIVPTLSEFSLGIVSNDANPYTIKGTGFMPGASTATLGGEVVEARFGNGGAVLSGTLHLDGPLRITTEGGYAEVARVKAGVTALPGRITAFAPVAQTGTPANPGEASANTGQILSFEAIGNLNGVLVQFDATDSQGQPTTVTERATVSQATGSSTITVRVPANARTGTVRVLGTEFSAALQIVPTLRASAGRVVPGQEVVIEGTGLAQAGAVVTIDGLVAQVTDVRRLTAGTLGSNQDRELLTVRVPAGAQAGDIRVTTPGGDAALSNGQAVPAANASHLTSIIAVASQGTPRLPAVASANVGQAISLSGIVLRTDARVVFTCMSSSGDLFEQTVRPTVVDLATGRIGVVVPEQATTGRVRLERDTLGVVLQIVPKVTGLTFANPFNLANVVVLGNGFTEGDVQVRMGTLVLPDSGIASGLDVIDRRNTPGAFSNNAITLPSDSKLTSGALTVSTIGGTSAPLARSVSSLEATAVTGTPANPAVASAAPGQRVTIRGSGLNAT
ncbi:hypothetical protein WDZ92_24420, partial [Nostoc sp. NIES-2111]